MTSSRYPCLFWTSFLINVGLAILTIQGYTDDRKCNEENYGLSQLACKEPLKYNFPYKMNYGGDHYFPFSGLNQIMFVNYTDGVYMELVSESESDSEKLFLSMNKTAPLFVPKVTATPLTQIGVECATRICSDTPTLTCLVMDKGEYETTSEVNKGTIFVAIPFI